MSVVAGATGALKQAGSLFAFSLDVLRALPRRPFQRKEFIQQSWFVASVTILPTTLVSIPFGAVIALQLGTLTRQLGAQSYTGAASVLAVIREASPIVTALLIAGAGGSAICADLGSRKIREEIEEYARRHGIPFDKAARRSRRGRVRLDETPKGAIADAIAQIALPSPGLEKTNPTYPPQPIIQTKFRSRLER